VAVALAGPYTNHLHFTKALKGPKNSNESISKVKEEYYTRQKEVRL